MSGRLGGIARHDRPRGPIETLDHVSVTRELGVRGDLRGAIRPGKSGRRQVSLIEAESWDAALADLKLTADQMLPWHVRRANLLVRGIRLPREAGKIIAIGKSLRIETTCECDPCSRMDQILPGLKLALMPDWRGGVLGRVISDGEIAVGDEVRIEE
ncbi:MOSC domain-containing protein [Novosphingobium subterraneum]|uniref:MOSC domain-containing protein n=1 Tax=Novosphingobium subterraneum TaxID=48936 RepID=UPI003D080145